MSHLLSPGARISVSSLVTIALNAFLLIVLVACGGGYGSGNNNNGGGTQSGTAVLAATVAAPGNFSSGQQNATYNITVTNSGTAATSGTVTVADPPTGFTVTSISGTGWTCTLSTTTCTRGDSLAAGQSFPPIMVTGNVTATNGASVGIGISLSGGGTTSAVNSTPSVAVAAPVLTIAKTHTGNFSAGQQGAQYTVTVKNGASAGATNAKVTVTETVPSGETLVSMAGTGWTCPGTGGANTCDRSDTLASGASYPAITATVNVAVSATSPQANQVSVSGGGIASPASATDSTTISLGPDLSILKSHIGTNFGAGTDGAYTIAVMNVGDGPTTGTITVTDTLPSQFTYVSATGTGWTCGAASGVVTCTNPGPIAAGTSASTISLIVSVSGSASGNINNTATVSTPGDTNTSNNSCTDTVNVLGSGSLPASVSLNVPGASATGVIYAGGNAESVTITVVNDQAGDVLTPALTLNGSQCNSTTCGTVASPTGSSGAYTAQYTPPASVAAATTITLTVSSSLASSFPATVNVTVYPAGTRVVKLSGVGSGAGPFSPAAYVYNDSGGTVGATVQLLGAGYACPTATSGTICGTLGTPSATSGTTASGAGTTGIAYTKTSFTYTPPSTVPNSPYDRPMILAVSNADPTARGEINFAVGGGYVSGGLIALGSQLDTVLTGTSTTTLVASFSGDTGVNKSAIWTLTRLCRDWVRVLSATTWAMICPERLPVMLG